MRRIAGQQHSVPAVGIGKPGIIRPSAGVFECFDANIHTADTTQHGFELLACHRSIPIFRWPTEVQHEHPTEEEPEHAT
jgi:hypothetical protein